MRQKPILAPLAFIAVTGAVDTPNSLADIWRVDVIGHHSDKQGWLERSPLIHTVADTDVPPNDSWPQDENYSRYGSQLWGLRKHEASPSESSHYGMEYKPGSAGEERQVDTHPYGNYFRNDQSSAFPTAPYSEYIYGGGPTTPSADPMIKELSRESSVR